MERRFRVILRNLVIAFAIIAVIIPFLPRRERVVNTGKSLVLPGKPASMRGVTH